MYGLMNIFSILFAFFNFCYGLFVQKVQFNTFMRIFLWWFCYDCDLCVNKWANDHNSECVCVSVSMKTSRAMIVFKWVKPHFKKRMQWINWWEIRSGTTTFHSLPHCWFQFCCCKCTHFSPHHFVKFIFFAM